MACTSKLAFVSLANFELDRNDNTKKVINLEPFKSEKMLTEVKLFHGPVL